MGTIDYISDLNLQRPRWTLYVKILSIWNQGIDAIDEPTIMILTDEKVRKFLLLNLCFLSI